MPRHSFGHRKSSRQQMSPMFHIASAGRPPAFPLVDHGHFNRIGLYDPFTKFGGQISLYLQTVLSRS